MTTKQAPAVTTIKQDTTRLLTRKKGLTYEAIVNAIKAKHPDSQTSIKTVQWYASRLRAEGADVNVKKLQGGRPAAVKLS